MVIFHTAMMSSSLSERKYQHGVESLNRTFFESKATINRLLAALTLPEFGQQACE